MSSGHEAQLYKHEEKLMRKKINVLHIISNDENIKVFDTLNTFIY